VDGQRPPGRRRTRRYVEGDDCDITSDIWLAYDDQARRTPWVLHDPSVPDTSAVRLPKDGYEDQLRRMEYGAVEIH